MQGDSPVGIYLRLGKDVRLLAVGRVCDCYQTRFQVCLCQTPLVLKPLFQAVRLQLAGG